MSERERERKRDRGLLFCNLLWWSSGKSNCNTWLSQSLSINKKGNSTERDWKSFSLSISFFILPFFPLSSFSIITHTSVLSKPPPFSLHPSFSQSVYPLLGPLHFSFSFVPVSLPLLSSLLEECSSLTMIAAKNFTSSEIILQSPIAISFLREIVRNAPNRWNPRMSAVW